MLTAVQQASVQLDRPQFGRRFWLATLLIGPLADCGAWGLLRWLGLDQAVWPALATLGVGFGALAITGALRGRRRADAVTTALLGALLTPAIGALYAYAALVAIFFASCGDGGCMS